MKYLSAFLIMATLVGCQQSGISPEARTESGIETEATARNETLVLQDSVEVKQQAATESSVVANADAIAGTASDPSSAESTATTQEFRTYLNRFSSASPWVLGERRVGEIAGRWTPKDDADGYIEFEVGGKKGAFATELNGTRAQGWYAISQEGKLVAFAKASSNGHAIGLGSHYQLIGEELHGPKGPTPNAIWIRKSKAAVDK